MLFLVTVIKTKGFFSFTKSDFFQHPVVECYITQQEIEYINMYSKYKYYL